MARNPPATTPIRAKTGIASHDPPSTMVEPLEGMNAFVERRKPDFRKFRLRNKEMVDAYLAGLDMSPEDGLK